MIGSWRGSASMGRTSREVRVRNGNWSRIGCGRRQHELWVQRPAEYNGCMTAAHGF